MAEAMLQDALEGKSNASVSSAGLGALAGHPAAEQSVELRAGHKVLDVAAGSGNVALSAARRNCDAVGIDYVPAHRFVLVGFDD